MKKIKEEKTEIDLTSMIDVCFLLIAFFIMVTEVSKAEVIDLYLPISTHSNPILDTPSHRVVVNMDDKGEVTIHNLKFGSLSEINNRSRLESYLYAWARSSFSMEQKKSEEVVVAFRGDGHVEYQHVRALLNLMDSIDLKIKNIHYISRDKTSV